MARNVQSIIDDLEAGLDQLRMHFESVGSIFSRMEAPGARGRKVTRRRRVRRARRVPAGRVKRTAPVRKVRKKTAMSPALRKQRQVQGRYMGLVKRLPKTKQAQVKKIRKEKGYEAALKMMK